MNGPLQVIVHEISTYGMPDMDNLTGRVAFIFDGCIVSGWPLNKSQWEGNTDVAFLSRFEGVTHWIEFPVPVWEIAR